MSVGRINAGRAAASFAEPCSGTGAGVRAPCAPATPKCPGRFKDRDGRPLPLSGQDLVRQRTIHLRGGPRLRHGTFRNSSMMLAPGPTMSLVSRPQMLLRLPIGGGCPRCEAGNGGQEGRCRDRRLRDRRTVDRLRAAAARPVGRDPGSRQDRRRHDRTHDRPSRADLRRFAGEPPCDTGNRPGARLPKQPKRCGRPVEHIVRMHDIPCEFRRLDGVLFLDPASEKSALDDESRRPGSSASR